MPPEIVDALRSAPSRGIGDVPVFPSAVDRIVPTSRHTFQIWLRRAKHRLLRSIEDAEERDRMRMRLRGVGYHAEKRAGVRDPFFRALPAKIQEEWAGANVDTLRKIYNDVTPEECAGLRSRSERERTSGTDTKRGSAG